MSHVMWQSLQSHRIFAPSLRLQLLKINRDSKSIDVP